jgi:hypothetical protein
VGGASPETPICGISFPEDGAVSRSARDHHSVVLQSAGTIIDTGWQRSFFPHLDAFLSTTRSIPEVIQCCFGNDRANQEMRDWFDQLPPDERDRRMQFKAQFNDDYVAFCSRRLSKVRHNLEHRTGVAPATVTIKGLFGDVYKGSPTQQVPLSETRQINDPDLAFLAQPRQLFVDWADFEIEGKPLFVECREHLDAASAVIEQGRKITNAIHGTKPVSTPPIY